ncbi:MAG: CynX/NimT family MFS transporter [Xanthobacteraceae bacterium]
MTSGARTFNLFCLLWLVGMSTRITILAVPPVIPLIRDDLRMTETQVGLLVGLPVLTWALAAIPGSLLIARLGATFTLAAGLALTGLAAAGRGAAPDVWVLYAATMLMGCGIAVMQPALPTLVREWVPHHIGLGTAVSSNGMMVGVAAGPALTIPFVLPLLDQSWRLAFLWWAAPVLMLALLFPLLAPRMTEVTSAEIGIPRRWWPDWKNPLIWLLGLTFGANNSLYYGTNAFLPDYLASGGRADLIGAALGFMNGSQFVASILLLVTADRLQNRVWPYLVFGPAAFLGVVGVVFGDGLWVVAAAALIGFSLAITFVVTLALPPVLSPPGDVHRMSAGMFTVSFSCAVIVPIVCGALWDLTGLPWTAFLLLLLCPLLLTALGFALSLHGRTSRRASV